MKKMSFPPLKGNGKAIQQKIVMKTTKQKAKKGVVSDKFLINLSAITRVKVLSLK